MKRLTLAVAAAVAVGSTAATAERPKWRFFDDAPSPFLQFSTARQGDVHRMTIACDGPADTIVVEQGLSTAEATGVGGMTLKIGKARLALPASLGADEREEGPGKVALARLDAGSAQASAIQASGPISVRLGATQFARPPIPRSMMRSFMAICRSQWARPRR